MPPANAPRPDPSDTAAPPAVLRWDPNPLVAVSRRRRNIPFPAAVLLRAPTEADVQAWETPQGKEFHEQVNAIAGRNDRVLTLEAGVTFLGCYATAWQLRGIAAQNQAPKSPPAPDSLILVSPASSARDTVLGNRSPFYDREAQRIDAAKVCAAWERVLTYLREAEARTLARDPAALRLFTAEEGFDAPDVVVLRLADVLGQRSDEARAVHPYMVDALKWAKAPDHLGALHDYAVRSRDGWNVASDCRKRAQAAPVLATQVG